ncbi:MAG: AMP-binding protein [Acidimicrobiia bacterium]
MIRLRDLRVSRATTWDEARAFRMPPITDYDIALDCLSGAPERIAIVEADGGLLSSVTYAELRQLSDTVAGHLAALGVRPGDRVAVKLSQSIDMAAAVFGILRAGAVVVPMSNVLAESSLSHRMADADPVVVVASGTAVERELVAATSARLVTLDELRAPAAPPVDGDVPGAAGRDADRPALLLYTSGTSGKPKGVLQAHRFLLGHHAVDLAFDHVRDDDVAYSPVDWTWGGGLMLGLLVPLAHGITVLAHREPRFDPVAAFELLGRAGVTIGLFPPTVLRMLRASGVMTADAVAATRLRCFITGAEAVEPDLIEWGASIGISINNAYGQTEANAIVGHAATLGSLDQRTMGRPYPGHEVDVLDEDLRPAGRGQPGQLAVRADDPVCMLRYWNRPEATAAKVRGGWLLTGDTVHWNDDGTLQFHGRNDDVIKSGAYRLGPAEIEAAVLRAPGVAECAVIGLPDPIRGQIVAAIVRLHPGATGDDELSAEIRASVRSLVGAHASPREIRYLDELPRTTTNKIDRAALRASLVKEALP